VKESNMSGKSRALAVAAATAGLITLWAPTAMASTASAPLGTNGWLVNGTIVNGGLVNVNLGSGNTAIGNTCNNTAVSTPMDGDVLTWALDIPHNTCVMAGGPNHF
jgi:hypothetical protein